jgi:prophage maintenance system killer protein
LIQAHPFASGNRRTAFVVVENFILHNGERPKVNKDASASVLQGIREDYYNDDEIKKWLKGGTIREFKR